jgi:SAM-dependent methyltransferase
VYLGDYFELDHAGDFQMTCLFDVLEHIEDDDAFLGRLGRTARPGHLLLLSVPACPFLFGPHDRLLHHYRRYSRRSLEELLRRNGYSILKASHFLFFLFPIAVSSRLVERLRARWGKPPTTVQLGVVPGWANSILTALLRVEAAVAEVTPLPVGLWVTVLAKRVPAA